MMKKLVLVTLLLSVSACSTMHFDKDEPKISALQYEHWHHNVVNGLVEVSQPVVLKSTCANRQWVSVKTEESFINGLASSLVNSVTIPVTAGLVTIWNPKTATVTCE